MIQSDWSSSELGLGVFSLCVLFWQKEYGPLQTGHRDDAICHSMCMVICLAVAAARKEE